jgi:hypothetical protein
VAHLCTGRIVWTQVADPRGHNRYPRPVVILTPDSEIEATEELFGVVASNTAALMNPRPPHCIELPFHPTGRVATKLKKATVAVCTWIVSVKKDAIEDFGGVVPPRLVQTILATRKAIDAAGGEEPDSAAHE